MTKSLRFNQEQKQAIIYALYQISKSDDHLDESELQFLSRVGELLGEVFDYLSISKLLVRNSPDHLRALMTFDDAQKEWFVIASYAIINSDDKLYDEEFTMAHRFFNVMDMSSEKAQEIIRKLDSGVRFY